MIKRLLLVFTLLFVVVSAAEAQSTSVTLQVTDAGAQTWNNGTWSVLLVSQVGAATYGPPFNLVGGGSVPNQSQNGSLSATGGASMTLTPNASVTPAQSQWQFKVCPQQGISFQCFIQSVTIAGGSQTVTLTPPAIVVSCGPGVNAYANSEVNCGVGGQYFNLANLAVQICIVASGNTCASWTSASSVPTVTVNPVTCSTGQTFFNTVTSQFLLCVATNTLSTAAGSPATTIDAKLYGVLNDTKILTSTGVSWTGATSTATVTAASPVFLASDVGKIMFGTNGCCGGVASDIGGVVTLPQGTISAFTSATVVTVSFSGTSVACNTTACIFVYGHDDTTALANAYTALVGLGADCGTLLLPAGKMLVQSAEFITAPTCTGTSGTISNMFGASETIEGFGLDSSILVPTPNFNFASCTGGGGSNSCFGGWRFAIFKDWSIWGAANASTGNNSKNIVELSIESYADKFGVVAWGASDTSLIGAQITNARVTNSIFRGAGQKGCNVNAGSPTWFVNTVCTYNLNIALANTAGAPFNSVNSYYGATGASGSSLQMSGNAWFNGDLIQGNTNGGTNTALVVLGGNTYLNGVTITQSLAAANALATNGGNAYAVNSTFGGGSSNSVNRIASTYFDLGGNTYTTAAVGIAPTCAMTSGGGTGPACAVIAGSTNEKGTVRMTPGTTPAANGTTTITFAGTFAGASNTTPSCMFDIANTGTGAWNLAADVQLQSRSTTVPVFTWNNTLALTAASTYDVDYVCTAK